MTGITTRIYRKSRIMENTLNQNKDLLWYAISLFCSFIFGVICSILFIWLLLYFKWTDIDSLGVSVTKIATFIVSLGTAIWAVIAKLHAPTGEIVKELQAKGNKPLDQIASNGLSITSTLFKGSQDVYFEQQTTENREDKGDKNREIKVTDTLFKEPQNVLFGEQTEKERNNPDS